MQKHLKIVVPTLMNKVKERALPVKLAAERTMLHVLAVHPLDMTVVDSYCSSLSNPGEAKTLKDYCTRILAKLAERSEDENSENEEEEEKSTSSSSSSKSGKKEDGNESD